MPQDIIDKIVQGFFGIVGAGGLVTLVTMLAKMVRSWYRARVRRLELEDARMIREELGTREQEKRDRERRDKEERERKRASEMRLNKTFNLLTKRINELEDMHNKCVEDHRATAEELGEMRGRLEGLERNQQFIAAKQERVETIVKVQGLLNNDETKKA